MEWSSIIIGITVLSLFILPVGLIMRAGKKKNREMMKELEKEAIKLGVEFTHSDTCNNLAIGFDARKRIVVILDERNADRKVFVFSPGDLKSFHTIPSVKTGNGAAAELNKTNRLSLVFSFTREGKPDLVIDLYNYSFGEMTDSDIELFIKWAEILQSAFRGRQS